MVFAPIVFFQNVYADMLRIEDRFPEFGSCLSSRRVTVPDEELQDEILPAASAAEIASLEAQLQVVLPASYKRFLEITRGVTFWDGQLQMREGHPFLHNFPPLHTMTWQQRFAAAQKGDWPPPSQGMLCFAEFWLDGEGDQALFDVRDGLENGEYPVYYYNHDRSEIRLLAHSFHDWLERVVTKGE